MFDSLGINLLFVMRVKIVSKNLVARIRLEWTATWWPMSRMAQLVIGTSRPTESHHPEVPFFDSWFRDKLISLWTAALTPMERFLTWGERTNMKMSTCNSWWQRPFTVAHYSEYLYQGSSSLEHSSVPICRDSWRHWMMNDGSVTCGRSLRLLLVG